MIGCITFGDIKVHLTGLSFPAWLLLHALLQVRRTTGFLPVLRCIPWLLGLSKWVESSLAV